MSRQRELVGYLGPPPNVASTHFARYGLWANFKIEHFRQKLMVFQLKYSPKNKFPGRKFKILRYRYEASSTARGWVWGGSRVGLESFDVRFRSTLELWWPRNGRNSVGGASDKTGPGTKISNFEISLQGVEYGPGIGAGWL